MYNLLEVDSVMQSYGNRQVLTDIYLKCGTGDIVGILGRNGCGKSTLLKIIFGAVNSGNKFVRINGNVYQTPFKAADLIGYLPQHTFLLPHLTIRKITELYLNKSQVEPFLNDPVIGNLQNNKINSLSGGELRYFEIKLMLNSNYQFIMLDEPFNGVAPILVERLKEMITEHAKTKGIILTDHDYNNVLDVANRYCLIHDGAIKHINDRQDLVRWGYLNKNSL
jgi:lipopolysaccharide export system ATP-binding protein